MKTIVNLISSLLYSFVLLFSLVNCDGEGISVGNDESLNEIHLYNKWELVEFVNDVDGTSRMPEPVSKDCYRIIFDRDNTVLGKSSSNAIAGVYEINQCLSGIKINAHFASEAMERSPDGELFLKNLNSSYRYVVTENTLKLYYAENDYLLLNIYEDEKK
jgi:hypothetical protein